MHGADRLEVQWWSLMKNQLEGDVLPRLLTAVEAHGGVPAAEHPLVLAQVPRRRMNIELNFPPNFEGLVLGCIDADFCK